MNSFIKKAFSVLLIGCLLVLGLGVVRVNAEEKEVTFTASNFEGQGTSGSGSEVSATQEGVTISTNKGYGGSEFRVYQGASFTISSTSTILSISFTFSGGKTGELSTQYDDINSNIWKQDSLASQARFSQIVVTIGDADPTKVFKNSVSVKNKLVIEYTKTTTQVEQFAKYSGSITEGDYIIYYNGKAMKNTVSSNRLSYKDITPVDNKISLSDATDDIVWHIAQSGEYWTIYNASANKYAASTGAANKAQLLESGTDDKSLWTVSGDSTYEFVNKENAAKPVNANLRNNGTYGFACYATGTGGALTLYKKGISDSSTYELDKDNENHLKVQLLFGQMIEKELYNDLIAEDASAKFGMLYITSENKGSKTFAELLEESSAYLRNVECIPVKVDNSGELSDSGTKMQFGVAISAKRFDDDITKDICCVAYAYINGEYYFSSEIVASVKSVAGAYVSEHLSNDEVQAHLGVLTWLSTYND